MTNWDRIAETIGNLLEIHEVSSYLLPGIFFLTLLLFLYFGTLSKILQFINPSTVVLFLILSYPIGHIIQSIGNIFEKIIAFCFGDLKKKILFIEKDNKLQRLSLKKLYELALVDKDSNVKRFKSHGKPRLGVSVSLLLFMLLGWYMHRLNLGNLFYTVFFGLLIVILLRYMRRAEDREIEEVLKTKYLKKLRKEDFKG